MANALDYALNLATNGFDAPLAKSEGKLGGFKGAVAKTGTALASMAAAAGAAVVAAGGLVAVKGLRLASELETTETALQVMVGSLGQTKTLISEIRDLGASTPFQTPDLLDATRLLVAFGEAASSVPSTLRTIGDVAAGTNTPIGELSELYGKARVQGTLFAEDINQLLGRGIPIVDEFAKMLGVGKDEVKKLASEGKITFPLLETAFKNLTAEGGKFHGLMAAQSQTTAGLWSTLKDNVNEVFLAIGQPINDALKPYLRDAIDLAQKVGQGIETGIEIGKNAVAQGKVGELLGLTVKLGLLEAVNAFSQGIFGAIFAIGERLTQIPGDILTGFQVLTDPNLYSGINDVFQGIATQFAGALLGSSQPFFEAFRSILNKIPGISIERNEKLGDFATGKGKAQVETGIDKIGGALAPAVDRIVGNFNDLGDAIAKGREKAPQFIDAPNALKAQIKNIVAGLRPPVEEAAEEIAEASTTGNIEIKEATTATAEAVKKVGDTITAAAAPITTNTAKDADGKIRTFGLADSLVRRFSRLSDADREKLGGSFFNFARSSGLNLAGIAPADINAAIARARGTITGAPGRTTTTADSTNSPTSVLGILRSINHKLDDIVAV